jgi:hypothetical protein
MLSVIAYFCLRNPTLRIAGNTGYPLLAVKTILAPRFPKQKNFPPNWSASGFIEILSYLRDDLAFIGNRFAA